MTNLDFIPTSATGSAEEVYLPAKQVMRRYGDRSAMWLWRILRDDPAFPKPIVIKGQRYFALGQLVAWEASKGAVNARTT